MLAPISIINSRHAAGLCSCRVCVRTLELFGGVGEVHIGEVKGGDECGDVICQLENHTERLNRNHVTLQPATKERRENNSVRKRARKRKGEKEEGEGDCVRV